MQVNININSGKIDTEDFSFLLTPLDQIGGDKVKPLSRDIIGHLKSNLHRPMPDRDFVKMRGSIDLLANLIQLHRGYLLEMVGIGPAEVAEIEAFLTSFNLELGMALTQRSGEWYLFTAMQRGAMDDEMKRARHAVKKPSNQLKGIKESLSSAMRILETPESELSSHEVKSAATQAAQAAADLYVLTGHIQAKEDAE